MIEKEEMLNNLRVCYKISGAGPAVLVLHGWGGSSRSWNEVQAILAKSGFRVIVPDFPGFGKSQPPPVAWGVDEYVKWVLDFTNLVEAENFFVIAHSFGGRVAIKFVSAYKEKIKGLILCSPAGIKIDPSLKTRLILAVAWFGNALFTRRIFNRFKDGAKTYFYSFIMHRDYVKANGIMKETMRKILGEDLLSRIPEIKQKTLIVWGKNDKMVPVKQAYIFKEKIGENAELVILKDIGHSPNLEVPKEFSEIIINFLKKNS